MCDDDAVDVRLFQQIRYTACKLQESFIVETFRADLKDLLTSYICDLSHFRDSSDNLIDCNLGRLVCTYIRASEPRSRNSATGTNDDDVWFCHIPSMYHFRSKHNWNENNHNCK